MIARRVSFVMVRSLPQRRKNAFQEKHDESFPINAIRYCLIQGGISAHQIENIVFYEKPFLKFEKNFGNLSCFCTKRFQKLCYVDADLA